MCSYVLSLVGLNYCPLYLELMVDDISKHYFNDNGLMENNTDSVFRF